MIEKRLFHRPVREIPQGAAMVSAPAENAPDMEGKENVA